MYEHGLTLKDIEWHLATWLKQKYVQTQNERQKAMGFQYMTAETHDLAGEIVKAFAHNGLLIYKKEGE